MKKLAKYESEGYDTTLRVINQMYADIIGTTHVFMDNYAYLAVLESLNLCIWPVCVGLNENDKQYILSQKNINDRFKNVKYLFVQHGLYRVIQTFVFVFYFIFIIFFSLTNAIFRFAIFRNKTKNGKTIKIQKKNACFCMCGLFAFLCVCVCVCLIKYIDIL